MALMRWDPWGDFLDIQRDLNRLFSRTFTPRSEGFAPAMDVFEEDDSFVIRTELPGVRPDEVDVTVRNGVLTITGDRKFTHEVSEERFYRRELSYGHFERQVALPEGVDPDRIVARHENGVLEIRVPKAPEVVSKKVHIEIGSGETK